MSRLSRELQLTLQAALREASERRHAYLTVEHLLYALLHEERGIECLRAVGADIEALKRQLQRFFAEDLEQVPGDRPFETSQTLAFHRVVQHAMDLVPLFSHGGHHHLPIVDLEDRLVGVITQTDLVRTLAVAVQGHDGE